MANNLIAPLTGFLTTDVNQRIVTPLGAEFPYATTNILSTLHHNMGDPDTESEDTIIAMAMVYSLGTVQECRPVVNAVAHGPWQIPATNNFTGEAVGANALVEAGVANLAPGALKTFCIKFIAAVARAPTYITDLVLAQQAKKMNKDNVKSYFAGMDMEKVRGVEVLRVISAIAMRMPMLRDIQGLVHSDTPWMKYRLSATSTPALVQRALDIWGDAVPNLVTADTRTLVTVALASPWDVNAAREIPAKLITLTHATLAAFKSLPDGWYYGESHKASCNMMLYRGYFKAATKLASLGAGTEGMDAATTMAQLIAAVPPTLLNA